MQLKSQDWTLSAYIFQGLGQHIWYISEFMALSQRTEHHRHVLSGARSEGISHLLRVSLDLLPSVDSLKELLLLLGREEQELKIECYKAGHSARCLMPALRRQNLWVVLVSLAE